MIYLLFNIFIIWRSNFSQFCFEFCQSWSEWAIKERWSSIDLKSTKNSWINLIGNFESDIRFAFLIGLNNLLFFLFVQLFSWDNFNIFFFVENLAIRNVSLNNLRKVRKSARLNDRVNKIIGDFMIVVFSETVEYLFLLTSFNCWILKEFFNVWLRLNNFVEMSQIFKNCLKSLSLWSRCE